MVALAALSGGTSACARARRAGTAAALIFSKVAAAARQRHSNFQKWRQRHGSGTEFLKFWRHWRHGGTGGTSARRTLLRLS